MLQKKRMTPTISLKFLFMSSNCDVTICKNHFVDVTLFLAGGDKVAYFLDRPPKIIIGYLICNNVFGLIYYVN